jgi:hypothetical protein
MELPPTRKHLYPDAGACADDQDNQDQEEGGNGGIEVIIEDLVLPGCQICCGSAPDDEGLEVIGRT